MATSAFDPFNHIPRLSASVENSKIKSTQFKAVQSTASVRIVHLIHGFVRDIQNMLTDDNIIPDEIYHLCLLFYHIYKINILFHSNYHHRSSKISTEFGVIDFEDKTSIIIKPNNLNYSTKTQDLEKLCYIPNISNKTLTKNQNLSGIFCAERKDPGENEYLDLSRSTYHPSLILFEQNDTDKESQRNMNSNQRKAFILVAYFYV